MKKIKTNNFLDGKKYAKIKEEIIYFLQSKGLTILETMIVIGEIYNAMEMYKQNGINKVLKDGETQETKPTYI